MSKPVKYFDPNQITHHPIVDQLSQHLTVFCENENRTFFRTIIVYWLGRVASQMRTTITTHKQKKLPVNFYGIALAPSGAGKGKSMNFMEDTVCGRFDERFKEELLPSIAEMNIAKRATYKAAVNGTEEQYEFDKLFAEFKLSGEWLNSFDSATTAAIKQFRHKLILAGAGALNFEIDEIGDNLTGNSETLSKFLELYDVGKLKGTLIKNTKENTRLSEVKGTTPCNMLMFGSPASLLDGSKKEDEFHIMLEKGYARRSIFSYNRTILRDNKDMTPEQIYDRNMSRQANQFIEDISDQLYSLADPVHYDKEMTLSKNQELLAIEYNLYCQDKASQLSEFEEVKRLELQNRSFKALKIAAIYAFIDGENEISAKHLYYAIGLVEESGQALGELIVRDRPYVKLAKYLGSTDKPVTQVEIAEDLPFYKGSNQNKSEMMTMAIAWGYKNNVIIKKSFESGIEFLTGESLKRTKLNEMIVSYSTDMAYNYLNETITWDQVKILGTAKGQHWINHHVHNGHRNDDNVISGSNILVIDVDENVSVDVAKELLKDFTYFIYTTKRHQTNGHDRFRIIMPMKYHLKLDGNDYKEFMNSVYDWMPFEMDTCTGQRARKWESHNGITFDNEGELFDPLPFIPNTAKNDERKQLLVNQQSMNNLERWFVNNTGTGNRSNQLIKFAYLLIDAGKAMPQVEQAVHALNDKLQDKLPDEEIKNTILVSARNHFAKSTTI